MYLHVHICVRVCFVHALIGVRACKRTECVHTHAHTCAHACMYQAMADVCVV